jgi:hypothetical protein
MYQREKSFTSCTPVSYQQRSPSCTATNRLLSGSAIQSYPSLAVPIDKKLHSLMMCAQIEFK